MRIREQLHDEDRILFRGAMTVEYANVIFDLDRAKALETVRGYLDDIGIHHCGRWRLMKASSAASGRLRQPFRPPGRRRSRNVLAQAWTKIG